MLKITDIAPDFNLSGTDGKNHSLKDYLGKKIILFFYPKDNTPGCSTEAEGFRDAQDELLKLNTITFGISKDTMKSHNSFVAKKELNFVLLADEDKTVCNLYDVLKEKTMFGKKYMGIERTTFIIDEEGKIEKIFEKVKVTDHVNEVLKYIANK